MRKTIVIALAAASVSLFAGPGTSATGYGLATAALYRPISITPNGFLGLGATLNFGQFISDGQKMTATLDGSNNLTTSSNVTPIHAFHSNASFTVGSDSALSYVVTTSAPAVKGSTVTIAPTTTSNAKYTPFNEGLESSTVTVGGTLSVPANTYGFVTAPFSVTVTYN